MNNIFDFIHMHGYGVYVWTAYGVSTACLLYQWIIPYKRWRRARRSRAHDRTT